MERKIIYQFITIALLLIIAVSLISLYNSKNSSIKSSIHNAEILSEILKNGLNTHIVNKDINEINTYINSFSNINNITNLWLVRNESINNQYGINENKKPRDEIDKTFYQFLSSSNYSNLNFIKRNSALASIFIQKLMETYSWIY